MADRLGADGRKRIHIWPTREGFQGSIGPFGPRTRNYPTIGPAVDRAWRELELKDALKGAVIIVEAVDG